MHPEQRPPMTIRADFANQHLKDLNFLVSRTGWDQDDVCRWAVSELANYIRTEDQRQQAELQRRSEQRKRIAYAAAIGAALGAAVVLAIWAIWF